MKILLTGFEPFGKSTINPSEQVVGRLSKESLPDVKIDTAVLPMDLVESPASLLKAIEISRPEAILCLGQASRRKVISIERVAVNLLDFRIPDNAGNQIKDQSVVPEGPVAYFTTLPVREILKHILAQGIPAELSLSAGTFICNQITYTLLHHLEVQNLQIPAGFIHLPALPEQVAQMKTVIPSMSIETMVAGIRTALKVIVKG